MSADLTRSGPTTLVPDPTPPHQTTGLRPLGIGAGLVLAASVVLGRAHPEDDLIRQVWDSTLWVVAPLAASAGSVWAARRVQGRLRAAWIAFASAALLAWLREPWLVWQHGVLGETGVRLALASQLLLCLALACGAALAVRRSALRPPDIDALLDAALALVAIIAIPGRYLYPLLVAPVEAVPPLFGVVVGVATPVALVYVVFFLLLRPDYALPRRVPPLLFVASIALLAGGIPLPGTWAGNEGLARLAPDRLATLVGWLSLLLAATAAGRGGSVIVDRRTRPWLQLLLAPTAALVLGALVLDMAFGEGPTLVAGITGALLALLLALRLTRTLRVDQEHAEAQRLLAQNSALVEVSRALADATDLNRTLDLAVRWACELLDAPSAGLELLDEEQGELELRAVRGLPSHLLGLRAPLTGSLTGAVVRSGKAAATSFPNYGSRHPSAPGEITSAFPTAAAPLHYRDERLGALFAIRFDRPFDSADLELLGALADQASLALRNAQLFEKVRALSLTDPLTGLANRRQLTRDLNREFAATRRGRRLVAVLFDIDNFKEYNDRYGHPAGDEVLRLFGEALARETRSMNLAARYGGDEFLSLLADTTLDGAQVFVERVVQHFQRAMAELGRGTITVSAGLAACEPSMETPEDLIAAADKAMYRVKPGRETCEEPDPTAT